MKRSVQSSMYSECIMTLESRGIPRSLCTLVENLFDCSNGDCCGNHAFTSFADVQLDLQLMSNDPARFLGDLQTTPWPRWKYATSSTEEMGR